jgi:hypothetical protein
MVGELAMAMTVAYGLGVIFIFGACAIIAKIVWDDLQNKVWSDDYAPSAVEEVEEVEEVD